MKIEALVLVSALGVVACTTHGAYVEADKARD